MSGGVVWIERSADGTKKVTRVNYETGERTVLSGGPKPTIEKGVRSLSNGLIGGEKVLKEQLALDKQLGVSDCVEYRPLGGGAYEAYYGKVGSFDKWMRAHKRVNHNAGCGTPAPGDFRGQCPPEFEDQG